MLDIIILIAIVIVFIFVSVVLEMMMDMKQEMEKTRELLSVIMKDMEIVKKIEAEILCIDRRCEGNYKEVNPLGYTE